MNAQPLDLLFDAPAPRSPDPQEILAWATDQFAGRIALSTSLGPQTLVVLDLLHRMQRPVPVFVLDTGLLFPETYAQIEAVEHRYGVRIEAVQSPLTVEDQAARDGEQLWATDPDRCCALRKVRPLRRRLQGLEAWITGLRRDPASSTRRDISAVGWDPVNGLVKVNPLWAWTRRQVLDYADQRRLPTNPLLDRGYRSIGCVPCTAPTCGDERSGRWAGTDKTECGLHWRDDL